MRTPALSVIFLVCLAMSVFAETAVKPPQTQITADKMITEEEHKRVRFVGNVEAIHEDLKLRADEVEVYSDENKETLSRIVAIGNVVVTKGERRLTGGHAELNYAEKEVVVTGSPTVNDKENRISGEKIIYSYGKEGIIVDGGSGKRATLLISSPKKDNKSQK